jgi:hypothetical protein
MPTRSNHTHPLINHPLNIHNNSNPIPATMPVAAVSSTATSAGATTNVDITSYIGKMLTINQHQVIVEDILGQGGFAFVFLVRSLSQQRYALKRMYVNNEHDLLVCQREISILKEFASNGHIVKYIDSSIQRLSPSLGVKRHLNLEKNLDDDEEIDDHDDDVIYEILLLTDYCSNGTLTVCEYHQVYHRTSPSTDLFICKSFHHYF